MEANHRHALGAAVGAVPGAVLGLVFGLVAKVRRDKPLHPVGRVGAGVLDIAHPRPAVGVPLLAEAGTHRCRVRWSRAAGLPSPLPDVEGLAVRVEESGSDLLFSSTGTGSLSRFVLRPRGRDNPGPQGTLLPVASAGGPLLFLVRPLDDGNVPPHRFGLEVARGRSKWEPVGVIEVPVWGPDEPTRFDPVRNPLPGTWQYPVVRFLREPAYLMARRAAVAKGKFGGVHHLDTDLVVHHHGRPLGYAPTLLFLHGLTDSGRGWPEAVRHWQERFAIVSYDARGHGESPRFTSEQLEHHPGEVMVADAVHLLEQLDRPVVVGHSLGGGVALAAAVRRPDLVRGVVLEDPAPRSPDEPQQSGRGEEFLAGIQESLAAPDEEALYAQRLAQHPSWPDSELLVTGIAEQQMDVEYLRRGDYKPTTPWSELYAAVQVPTLVITGDNAGEVLVSEEVEEAIARIGNPHVTVVRIPGAGHCIRRDQPAAFYSTVDEWLSRSGA